MLSSAPARGAAATLIAALLCGFASDAFAQPPPYPYPPQPYPPPYGYPPPPYGYPPHYPVAPPPSAPAPPPQPQPPGVVYDWDPDAPPPDGYTMVDTINSRTLVTGITLLATGWLLSVFVAGVGSTGEEKDGPTDGDGVDPDDWTPLYIPVAGPFVAMGTLDPSPAGVGVLLADGILQLGGALGIVVGIVDRKYKLVRHASGGLSLTANAAPHFKGLSATGRF